jgi:serine/threonine-protein kinase
MSPVEGVEPGPFTGQFLDGRYRLESLIAAGGMGEVWRARDELLGRPVAVKLVKDAYAGDEAFLARFRSEARTAAALSHPGVAQVFDYGEHNGSPLGRPFLVMELVSGRQLSALLATVGTLPAGVVLDIVGQAARALYAAQRIGITHRDIKPSNLLVTDDGRVKITDFGIAAGPGPRAAGTPGTEQRGPRAADREDAGLVLGTPAYMSPEQAKGKPVTPASDIYSLGMVAYQCAAGRLPFTGGTPLAIAIAHAEKQPRRLPGAIPAPVRELIMGMIAADPRWRPAAAEVAESASVLLLFTDGPQLADVAASVPAGPGGLLTDRDQPGKTLLRPLVHFRRPADSRNGHRRRTVIAAAVLAASAGGLSAAVAAAVVGNPAPIKHTDSHRPVAVAPTRTPRPTRRSTPPPSKAPLTISAGNTQPAQPLRATSAPAPPPSSPASPPPPRSPSPSPSATPIGPPTPTPTPPPTSPPPTSPPPTSPPPTSPPPTSPPPPRNQVGQATLAIG